MKNKTVLIRQDKTIISNKIKEAYASVLPITIIVLILSFSLCPIESGLFLAFILGALCIIVGIGLFSLGADVGMTPIGQYVSASVVKTKKLFLILPIYFVVGTLITISEPDLQVLAHNLSGVIQKYYLLISVGVGVGLFLAIAFLRIIFKLKLSYILIICYIVVFVLSFFVPKNFVPLAFDSGGVTTGPMSVPFIIAIGTGVVSIRADKDAETDAFGLTALCSVGPILAVMVLGIIFKNQVSTLTQPIENTLVVVENSKQLLAVFVKSIPLYLEEVAMALLPIVGVFFVVLLFDRTLDKNSIIRIIIGVVYTYLGLVIFLLGVNVGFAPIGSYIGEILGGASYNWIMVPIGMVLGFFVVSAEPAVHVLTMQVYEITGGQIPKKALSLSLMIGTAVAVGIAMLRIIVGIDLLYFLIPGYLVALILTFFVPNIFTAIAFDSGGVASGAMTACFLLPLALGLCKSVGSNVMTDGFGLVAIVAMIPLITIQVLGLIYKIKTNRIKKQMDKQSSQQEEIIE